MKRWACGSRSLVWGERTLVMGVVNVTPDSFSDGGQFFSSTHAISHAVQLAEQGADILDIGGESTRPGADPVSVEEECRRVVPVVQELATNHGLCVSIDTVHYETAARCCDAGACIINDVSGLQRDPRLATLAAETGAGLILMHMRGTPETMQTLTEYDDVCRDVHTFLIQQCDFAQAQGVKAEQLAVDPGIGFSKTAEQNLELLRGLANAIPGEYPALVGVSRKSFLGRITGRDVKEREWATAAAVSASVLNGANIVRVHDVAAMMDVVRVADAVRCGTFETAVEV